MMRPEALTLHDRGGFPCAAQIAENFDVDVSPEDLVGDVWELRCRLLRGRSGGAVHENVDPAVLGDNL